MEHKGVEYFDLGVRTRKQHDRRDHRRRPPLAPSRDYFGYLNSGAAFNASLVVLIDANHLSFLLS
jgi:hypothetical protein